MGIDLRTFQNQATQQDGVFQLGKDQTAKDLIIETKPGILGKKVARWIPSKETPELKENRLRAAQSFIMAMQEYFGDESSQIGLQQRKVTANIPLTSDAVRHVIEAAQQYQGKKLDELCARAQDEAFSGLPFLSELIADDCLKNQFTADVLRKHDFPKGSVAAGVRNALKDGLRLSQKDAIAIFEALQAGARSGDAAKFFDALQRKGCLDNETMQAFIGFLPPASITADKNCQGLLHLLNAGLLNGLARPDLVKITSQNGRTHISYQSPMPDLDDHKADILSELEQGALQHRDKSLQDKHIAPFIQGKTLDSAGLLGDSNFATTQFGKDLRRDTGENEGSSYKLNGKEFVGNPEGAIQELWAIAGKNPQRFGLLCNLMTQNSLIRPVDRAIGSNDKLADGSNVVLNNAKTERGYNLTQDSNGIIRIKVFEQSSNTPDSKFYLLQNMGAPNTVLHSTQADSVRSTRFIELGLAPNNQLDLYAANHDIAMATPLASLAPIAI